MVKDIKPSISRRVSVDHLNNEIFVSHSLGRQTVFIGSHCSDSKTGAQEQRHL